MPNSIEEMREFVQCKMKDVLTEMDFYKKEKLSVPQFSRGMLVGKERAYENMLGFLYEMEHLQRGRNENIY